MDMAVWRYKISLWVLQNILHEWAQQTSEIFFNTRREICISKPLWKVLFIININEILNCFNFAAKGAIYYVTMATAIFLLLKITCYFRLTREDIMFLHESTPCIWCLHNKHGYLLVELWIKLSICQFDWTDLPFFRWKSVNTIK